MSGATPIDIVREAEIRADPGTLARRWIAPRTFAVVPNNLGAGAAWLDRAVTLIPAAYQSGHFALLTSGSTGQPKLIVALKRRAEQLAEAIHAAQDADVVGETIACLPLSYTYAFVNQFVWAHHLGRRLVQTDGFTRPDELKRVFEAANDAMTCMVGVQVPLLQSVLGGHRFPGITRLNFAGGRFPQAQLPVLRQMFPNAQVFNNYGCAEAMPRLTVRRAEAAVDPANIGWPLPGVELRVGADDQLEFRSPFRAKAYIEGDTFRRIDDAEWTETGDLGREGERGSWMLLGRSSEVFKRFGEKISLPSVQSTVQRAWAEEVAFYREVDSLGENAHVMVVAPRPTHAQVRSILAGLRRDFKRPHWPLRIESVDSLPRLSNNKIDIQALGRREGVVVEWRQRY